MKRFLKSPEFIVALVAALFYGFRISPYLPFGDELKLATDWLGLTGDPALGAPIWGTLVKAAYALPFGSIAGKLGAISAIAGVITVWLFAYVIRSFLALSILQGDRLAGAGDLDYHRIMHVFVVLSSLVFIFTPAISLRAIHAGPTTVCLALALAPFATILRACAAKRPLNVVYLTVLTGFFAMVSALESPIGVLLLPIVLVLACLESVRMPLRLAHTFALFTIGAIWGFAFSADDWIVDGKLTSALLASARAIPAHPFFPGVTVVAGFAVAPVLILHYVFSRRLVKVPHAFVLVYLAYTITLAVLAFRIVIARQTDYGGAADTLVERAIAQLGERKWIVSDGLFDPLILLKKPADARLVTLAREYDLAYGATLTKWASEAEPDNDDIRFAAELGPRKFLDEWSAQRPSATAGWYAICLSETNYNLRRPCNCGWSSMDDEPVEALEKSWRDTWREFAPFLENEDEPGRDLVKRHLSVQGNAIGCIAAAAKDYRRAWKILRFVNREVDSTNFSTLLNLVGLIDYADGLEVANSERTVIDAEFGNRVKLMSGQPELRYEIAVGGRVFVDPSLREQLIAYRHNLAKTVWDTPFGIRLKSALDGLAAVENASADLRDAEIERMERTILPQLQAEKGPNWAKWWLSGEFYMLKGGEDLVLARQFFRKLLSSGNENSHYVFDKLLSIDIVRNELDEVERDALLILRRDVRHQLANALLGSARLEHRQYDSAEHYLRRAISLGDAAPGIYNDLALALSGLGRHDEAEQEIRTLLKKYPTNWNYADSLAIILAADSRPKEAAEASALARQLASDCGDLAIYEKMLNERN